MADLRCRAVLFGGSNDNGYARLLQPYVPEDSKSSRIILIEGPPFVRELAALKHKFLVTHLPNVFRSTELSSRRVSFSRTPPSTPIPNAPSYARATLHYANSAVAGTDSHYPQSAAVPVHTNSSMLQNSRGQRLDSVINPVTSLVDALKDKKHCNSYHILGECLRTSGPRIGGGCSFLHGNRLDKKGIEARRWVARQKMCPAGFKCRDEKCLNGHECPTKACKKVDKGCVFPREMYNVDRK